MSAAPKFYLSAAAHEANDEPVLNVTDIVLFVSAPADVWSAAVKTRKFSPVVSVSTRSDMPAQVANGALLADAKTQPIPTLPAAKSIFRAAGDALDVAVSVGVADRRS